MHIGLGLYPGILDDDNLRFARQIGATHIVAWMPLPAGNGVWEYDDLLRVRKLVESHGLKLAALENLPPAQWDHVLMGEPGRDAQIERVKQTIRNIGKAGISCLGYYFSVVGVWGHWRHGNQGGGRGDAGLISFDMEKVPDAGPLPRNKVWGGMGLEDRGDEPIAPVGLEEMWARLAYFLERVVPVAEEAGVRLAAHPDDPPVPALRGVARLLTSPDALARLTEIVPSDYNGIEFCQGTVTEMGCDVIATIRRLASRGKIHYVHFRAVRGAVPRFDEVFMEEGDVDMREALCAYQESGFTGVLIPDHTPSMTCAAPWHAGMAYAAGYMRAVFQELGIQE